MNPLADKFIGAYLCKLCIKTRKRSKTRRFRHMLKVRHNKKILSPGVGKRGFMIIPIVNKGEVDLYTIVGILICSGIPPILA